MINELLGCYNGLQILSLSIAQPIWLDEIVHGYHHCPETAKLLAYLSINNTSGDYTLKEGIIRYKGRILVPPPQEIQLRIISSLHSSLVGGHSGYQVTYNRIKNIFQWIKLKQMVKEFV